MEHMGYELTADLSRQAYERDKAELLNAFDPRYVTITEERTPTGCLGQFRITVKARSYTLSSEDDVNPKPVNQLSFRLKVFDNYPAISPKIWFEPGCRLAHVNTYRSGTMCTDKWGKYSSLVSITEKTIRAVIYDESVTRYDSMACTAVKDWQQSLAAKGSFPTLSPDLILKPREAAGVQAPPPLPVRKAVSQVVPSPSLPPRPTVQTPPPLPRRG